MAYRQIVSEETQECSEEVGARVIAARERQRGRSADEASNGRLTAALLRRPCHLDAAGRRLMEQAVTKLGLSARAHDRVLRVARTIADLAGLTRIEAGHLAEAIQYRGLDRGDRLSNQS